MQEAVKLIHGLPTLAGKGFIFEGMNHTSYTVEYTPNADCMSHYTLPKIVHMAEQSKDLTLEQLRKRAQTDLGATDVIIEFSRDVVQKFVCPACHAEEEVFAPVGSLSVAAARCAQDGQPRAVIALHSYTGQGEFGKRRLDQLGLPLMDIFTARVGDREIGYLPYGDAPQVLGALAEDRGVQ